MRVLSLQLQMSRMNILLQIARTSGAMAVRPKLARRVFPLPGLSMMVSASEVVVFEFKRLGRVSLPGRRPFEWLIFLRLGG